MNRFTGITGIFFPPNTRFKKKGAYRTHRFSVISVIPAKYRLLFSVIPAKYRLLFSVISVIPAIIFGNTGNTGSPTVASMCHLLRIQKPVYLYLPVFFFGISKTVLGRYRYSLMNCMNCTYLQIQRYPKMTELTIIAMIMIAIFSDKSQFWYLHLKKNLTFSLTISYLYAIFVLKSGVKPKFRGTHLGLRQYNNFLLLPNYPTMLFVLHCYGISRYV